MIRMKETIGAEMCTESRAGMTLKDEEWIRKHIKSSRLIHKKESDGQ